MRQYEAFSYDCGQSRAGYRKRCVDAADGGDRPDGSSCPDRNDVGTDVCGTRDALAAAGCDGLRG